MHSQWICDENWKGNPPSRHLILHATVRETEINDDGRSYPLKEEIFLYLLYLFHVLVFFFTFSVRTNSCWLDRIKLQSGIYEEDK